jgi:hypothetical protein
MSSTCIILCEIRRNKLDVTFALETPTRLSIRRSQSLDQVITTVDPFVFLIFLCTIRPGNRLDVALEVGVAKVSATKSANATTKHHYTHAMLYRGG